MKTKRIETLDALLEEPVNIYRRRERENCIEKGGMWKEITMSKDGSEFLWFDSDIVFHHGKDFCVYKESGNIYDPFSLVGPRFQTVDSKSLRSYCERIGLDFIAINPYFSYTSWEEGVISFLFGDYWKENNTHHFRIKELMDDKPSHLLIKNRLVHHDYFDPLEETDLEWMNRHIHPTPDLVDTCGNMAMYILKIGYTYEYNKNDDIFIGKNDETMGDILIEGDISHELFQ